MNTKSRLERLERTAGAGLLPVKTIELSHPDEDQLPHMLVELEEGQSIDDVFWIVVWKELTRPAAAVLPDRPPQ